MQLVATQPYQQPHYWEAQDTNRIEAAVQTYSQQIDEIHRRLNSLTLPGQLRPAAITHANFIEHLQNIDFRDPDSLQNAWYFRTNTLRDYQLCALENGTNYHVRLLHPPDLPERPFACRPPEPSDIGTGIRTGIRTVDPKVIPFQYCFKISYGRPARMDVLPLDVMLIGEVYVEKERTS